MTQTPYFTTLNDRGQLRISGADRKPFLQGLISNDIDLLESQECFYSCILTPQGKFLYDFIITELDEILLLDCEGNARAKELAKLLSMYKLRADVHIEIIENVPIYAIIGHEEYGYRDPRHIDMGFRSAAKPVNLPEKEFKLWDMHRITLTVPDGSRDMISKKSTLLECNIDKLNGLSYDKGCYLGQELTARMHYRGLAKKHLYTITATNMCLEQLPNFGESVVLNGKTIGEMRSSCGNIGLALIKDEYMS